MFRRSNRLRSAYEGPAIVAEDLGFGYEDQPVFRHLNLTLARDEFVGLIGANGAGKSTLIHLLLGLKKPQEGRILLFGQEQQSFKDWGRIGYVSQKAASFNSSFPGTVEEVVLANLWSQLGFFHRPRALHREKVEQALECVGLQNERKRLIGNLSGGQQQRVFLARMLVNDPEMIFLDEPTTGVDAKSEGEIYQLLHKLNEEQKIGILLISHDIGAITVHVQRLLCMGADGFFEHNHVEAMDNEFLHKLYGYSVVAHSHLHPSWPGGKMVRTGAQTPPDPEQNHLQNPLHKHCCLCTHPQSCQTEVETDCKSETFCSHKSSFPQEDNCSNQPPKISSPKNQE